MPRCARSAAAAPIDWCVSH